MELQTPRIENVNLDWRIDQGRTPQDQTQHTNYRWDKLKRSTGYAALSLAAYGLSYLQAYADAKLRRNIQGGDPVIVAFTNPVTLIIGVMACASIVATCAIACSTCFCNQSRNSHTYTLASTN